MHSASSALSFSSLIQYAFVAAIVYVLAGAPLSNLIRDVYSGGASEVEASANLGKLENLAIPEANLSCSEHAFKGVYVLHRDPLVVYIEGFLSDAEADHVVDVSTPSFQPSTIFTAGQEHLDTKIRNSDKAALPRDHTAKCIEDRARRFQGWKPFVFIEKLWAQRYNTGGHYTYHYDWTVGSKTHGRVSSFMVYLAANCTGGGTHFPRLPRPMGDEWCRFIECGEEYADEGLKQGVIFKPMKGNAVFWENMRQDGSGYLESWHAGMPVTSGSKIGLNIWSWLQVGYAPVEGSEDGPK